MSKHIYALTYFDTSGRAELARMLFHYASVPFKDIRIKYEDWDNVASDYEPYRKLPILEIDGKVKVTQSLAIARYLAREFGLDGKTNVQRAVADSVAESCQELFHDLLICMWQGCKDDNIGAQSAGTLLTTEGPRLIKHLEDILAENGGPFITGKEMTWADLAIADMSTKLKIIYGHFDLAHPALKELIDRVWVSKRELTTYLDNRPADQIEQLEEFCKKRLADGGQPGMFGILYEVEPSDDS